MRTLRFLVVGSYNQFTGMLVDYLVDCGYFVDIIDDLDTKYWLNLATQNIKLVDKSGLNEKAYDYMLNVKNKKINICIPEIRVEVKVRNKRLFVQVQLLNGDKLCELVNSEVDFDCNRVLLDALHYSYSQITESFIDAVIILSRTDANDLSYEKAALAQNNVLSKLIQANEQLQLLQKYYQRCDLNESKFIFRLFDNNLRHIEFYSNEQHFSQEQLEIFTLYLLMLLNARNSALYSYDLKLGKKTLTKYIDLSADTNYTQLVKLVNSNHYKIMNNIFYINHCQARFNIPQSPGLIFPTWITYFLLCFTGIIPAFCFCFNR